MVTPLQRADACAPHGPCSLAGTRSSLGVDNRTRPRAHYSRPCGRRASPGHARRIVRGRSRGREGRAPPIRRQLLAPLLRGGRVYHRRRLQAPAHRQLHADDRDHPGAVPHPRRTRLHARVLRSWVGSGRTVERVGVVPRGRRGAGGAGDLVSGAAGRTGALPRPPPPRPPEVRAGLRAGFRLEVARHQREPSAQHERGGRMSIQVETVRTVEVPTRMVHGPGAIDRLGGIVKELGVRRPLLVTDGGVVGAGLAEKALEHLTDASVFEEVRPNPDVELIGRTSEVYREEGCDGLVALGGGSSMDTAKGVGVEITGGGSIADYEYGKPPITRRIPPLVTVPTTAGTGSEVTLWAVITDHGRKIKFNVGGMALIGAHVALIDPALTVGLPAAITAATGMDALSHGIECYTCDYHQPFTDSFALTAIEYVARWLRAACQDGANMEARMFMAHGATFGGMAYGTESAGAAHAMSQSAGGVHDCPHGALTARVLGPVCEYNAPAAPERYARIAQALGADIRGFEPLEAALAGIEELHRLTEDVGIPTMEELGFSEDEIPMLAQIAYEDPQTVGNPREVTVADYEEIYHDAFARGK